MGGGGGWRCSLTQVAWGWRCSLTQVAWGVKMQFDSSCMGGEDAVWLKLHGGWRCSLTQVAWGGGGGEDAVWLKLQGGGGGGGWRCSLTQVAWGVKMQFDYSCMGHATTVHTSGLGHITCSHSKGEFNVCRNTFIRLYYGYKHFI